MPLGQNVHVLLVDDDDSAVDAIRSSLPDSAGLALQCVTNVAEAENAIGNASFDAVLLSLTLTDHPGLIAVTLLQAFAPDIPIIAIANDEPSALKAVHQGCADYLLSSQTYDTVLVRSVKHAVEAHRTGAALHASEARYRELFEQSRDAIFMTDETGSIVDANRALLDLVGVPASEIVGLAIESFLADAPDRTFLLLEQGAKRTITDQELRVRRQDGRLLWCLVSLNERRNSNGESVGYQGIIHDITDRKRAEERLLYNAYHDVLTGLPNRALFLDRLERAIVHWRRHHEHSFAVMFVDLNRFKIVNDSLGHAVGDELLRAVGACIKKCLRDEDTVARLGGDEFAVLLDTVENKAEALMVAHRIHSALETPIPIGRQKLFTSCSIGIAMANGNGDSPEDMLRNADLAMYKSKSDRAGDRITLYTTGMHTRAINQLELETELHEAVRNNEFQLQYQPIFESATEEVAGFEALLRWNHPRHGVLAPATFLPTAEDTGLILQIGRWVIRAVCSQLKIWQDSFPGPKLPFLSLNVSGSELTQPGFVSETIAAVREARIDPANLIFELTETSLLKNPDSCADTISKLRAIGIRFFVDDFGTGYSSLSYLHRLPINGLKIDRSFVAGLDQGEGPAVISAIVSLANNLGIYAVAEGVETDSQLSTVRALGPQYLQGYRLARPLTPKRAGELVV